MYFFRYPSHITEIVSSLVSALETGGTLDSAQIIKKYGFTEQNALKLISLAQYYYNLQQENNPLPLDSESSYVRALVTADPYSPLVELYSIVGFEKFKRLLELFGGTTLSIPKPRDISTLLQQIHIYEDHEEGLSITQLSEKYSLPSHTIKTIIERTDTRLKLGLEQDTTNG